MREALLAGLRRRVARDPAGRVVLPVGHVEATEAARVVRALDRARDVEGR
jgi:hypothetical protein